MKTTIPISEEFSSIQGEGTFTGVPSYFIRTSGCNLRCWWCDTPYTSWRAEMSPTAVSEILDRIAADPARHVVVTGGEPMLYPEQVADLIRGCSILGKPVTVETNGTVHDDRVRPFLFSVSPKLPSSTPTAERTQSMGAAEALAAKALHERNLRHAPLDKFREGATAVQYKFVVTDWNDVLQVQSLAAEHRLSAKDIWLMPEGRTPAEVMAKHLFVAEACKRNGYNMSTRLHTLTWGVKRGV